MRRLAIVLFLLLWTTPAWAGPIFLTGHDPDFHAQGQVSGQNILRVGLNFVTGGTFDDGAATKFLWVESRIAPPGGHFIGENGLIAIGLTLNTNYDRANAAELPGVNLSNYTAIAIASSYGGLLTKAELDALIARKDDIKNFINAGGGLFAAAECLSGPCDPTLLAGAAASDLYGYLPVIVSSVATVSPYIVTPFGAALGLTDADVSDCCTHNAFGEIGGLDVVDNDQNGVPTTLAGEVRIGGGGFCGDPPLPPCDGKVSGPASLLLLASGLGGLLAMSRRMRGSAS